jgi:hypothetical protein
MARDDDHFDWTPKSEEAAQLLAEGDLSTTEIGERLDLGRSTLWRWRQYPEFAAKVEEIRETIRTEIRRHGIAVIEQRVAALHNRWKRLERVIRERGNDPGMQDVPGGATGLLVRRVKMIGTGPGAREVEEFAVDTGLLSELRAHEQQAAQELGQWTSKTDVTSGGEPVKTVLHFEYNGFGPDPRDSSTGGATT